MTEIQFLAQFILNESIPQDIRQQMVDRIIAIEQSKPFQLNTPLTSPTIFGPVRVTCQHEYPSGPWGSTTPPHCIKCGYAPGLGQGNYGGGGGCVTVTHNVSQLKAK